MRGKILVAAILCLSVFASGQKASKPKHSKSALAAKAKATHRKAAVLKTKLKKTKRQIGYVVDDIHKADVRLEETKAKLDLTNNQLSQAKVQQRAAILQLQSASQRLAQKKKLIAERMRLMYMQGDPNPISAFVGAESFSDAADRAYVMHKIAEQDDRLVDELKRERDQVNQKKAEKDKAVARVASLRSDQLTQKQQLDLRKAAKRQLLDELKEAEQQTQNELDALEKESAAIEAELRRYYQAHKGGPVYTGRFKLPVNGARLTSPFGYRVHPILKRRKLHTGMDLAAPSGTPIHAAAPGRVIYAGYRGGYGNCVMIDHGGGVVTLYGHCSRLYVANGRTVKVGDVIAAVGSTGFSTGPHCHFEVRLRGTPVNPISR